MRLLTASLLSLLVFVGGCDEPPDGSPDLGRGDVCSDTSECRRGLECSGTCQPLAATPEGSICSMTDECQDGLYCGPMRTCAPAGTGSDGDDCQSTAECERGSVCSLEGFAFRCRPSGTGDLEDRCDVERDCYAGLSCRREDGESRCVDPASFHGDGGMPLSVREWQGETCAEDPGPATAYFHVRRGDDSDRDFYRQPFPNDILRTASGLDLSAHPSPTILPIDVLGRHLEAAAEELDGFAMNPVIFFRFSQPYEWADVSEESVLLVDVTPTSPEFGAIVGRQWLTTEGRITRYICPHWLGIRRSHGDPLRPGTTYAAILTTGIRASGGEPYARAADLDSLLADAAPGGEPLASAWTMYQPLRAWLAMPDTMAADDVLNATVFTTQDPAIYLRGMREAAREASVSVSDVTLCDDGVASPCDDGGQRVCGAVDDDFWEVHARIALPRFQAGTAPYEDPADGGGVTFDASGRPIAQGTEDVCMVMTIPKGVPAPPTGFPVVLYGHGTGGAFTAPVTNGLAAQLATENGGSGVANAITVSIDMPLHGSRANGSGRTAESLVYNFANPAATRGTLLQGTADFFALVHWAEGFTLASAEAPTDYDVTFDPTRILIWGHSQGATHAMMMVPFEPSLRAALISGGGGDLTESLLSKTSPVNISAAVPLALLDSDAGALVAGDLHPALAILQGYYERVDPVSVGRYYYREPVDLVGHHVFMTYGLGDTYSTERTLSAFARSLGMPHVMPVLVDAGLGDPIASPARGNVAVDMLPFTMGMRQYTPAPGDDGHFVSTLTTDGRDDAVRFVLEAAAGAVPPIGG